MSCRHLVVHYSEIGLKKGNRGFFEKRLRENIITALRQIATVRIGFDFGRFIITLPPDTALEPIIERLKSVIGIAHFSPAFPGDLDVEILKEQVLEKLRVLSFASFCIKTRRADKSYPLRSVDVNRIVGARIHGALDIKVDLSHPELTCSIEIFNKKIFFSWQRCQGPGGLPVGSGGKIVSLLSSGIDSPVAAYRMMTRGCRIVFVHFHSFPYTDKSSYYNALQLAEKLTLYQGTSRVYLVPLAELQRAIIISAPAKLRIILYRRMMFQLAEKIVRLEKARAIVTGESLGQVASQTIENIAAIQREITVPVLRPLIGLDKESITRWARELGTFPISTEPYDDCCSYLMPRTPETRAKWREVAAAENAIPDREPLLEKALSESEIKQISLNK